jgi:hypothetical protein
VIKLKANVKRLLNAKKIVEKEIRKTIPANLVSATVGLHKDTGLHNMRNVPFKIPVAQVGAFGHFGRNGQDPRPWLDTSLKRNINTWKKAITWHAKNDKNLNFTMENTAAAATNIMKKYTVDLKYPENSPVTVGIKGFDDPLIHTLQMYHSINYKMHHRSPKK